MPYGELLVDEHSSSEDMPYKFNGKELDEETGLYYYGARYMQPITSVWYGIDPLTEKYPDVSAYTYCMGNPVKLVDSDGKDCVSIIDNENKSITIKANYYVETEDKPSNRNHSNTDICRGYTDKNIAEMNKYSNYLNGLNLSVSKGEYEGYSIQFDLAFIAGGTQFECEASAQNDIFEQSGINIGNAFLKNDQTNYIFRLKNDNTETSSFNIVGGVCLENNVVMMNCSKYENISVNTDTKFNRLHEIFHTFGFEDYKKELARKGDGIMKYPPEKPNSTDANTLIYNDYMKKRRFFK